MGGRQWAALVLVAGMAAAVAGCDLSGRKAQVRDTVRDPLVRERVLRRIEELYEPAKEQAETVRELSASKECDGVCPMAKSICDVSSRVCDLAGDFPKDDEEVQEKCRWSSTDCDSARVACAGCGGYAPETVDDEE